MGLRRKRCAAALCISSIILLYLFLLLLADLGSFRHPSDSSSNGRATSPHVQVWGRRLLERWGPGSLPPGCASKCGACTPCRAVHVPVSPGTPVVVVAEYYPEAWRCKCGNRLYKP